MKIMVWEIIIFESKRGEKFVEEFIKSLSSSAIAKITHGIDLLEKHGPYVGMPHSKRINNELYELRIQGKEEIRIIYAFLGRKIYLLHGFKKKKQKTPVKYIGVATNRLHSILE